MRSIIFILIIALNTPLFSNDGAFYTAGNQLIPAQETDISVKKEILTIKRENTGHYISDNYANVTVEYEFFNPGDEKEIIVGFEAKYPYGDVIDTTYLAYHPFISEFTVMLNSESLNYDTKLITDNFDKTLKDISENESSSKKEKFISSYYVYYFKAKFEPGLNKIKHTYRYKMASLVGLEYEFHYILSAANRWANNQIDDFTLILDLGEYQEFYIDQSFFVKEDIWQLDGIYYDSKIHDLAPADNPCSKFINRKGEIVFHKKNFHPKGELLVYSIANSNNPFDYSDKYIPFNYLDLDRTQVSKNRKSLQILQAYPYARRGARFKEKWIQEYFENQEWYIPNKIKNLEIEISQAEKEWIKRLKIED